MLTFSVLLFFLSGILYNIPPFRFKDWPYLDFLFEALNSPLRLLAGWYAVADSIVPSSFLLAYWFFGAFLMAAKRFGELRFINDKELALRYRVSFRKYSEKRLLISMVVCITASSYMLGALALKRSVDLVLFLPFFLLWLGWFFRIAYEKNTIVKDPERIFENIPFLFYSILTVVVFVALMFTKKMIFNLVY